MTARLRPVRTLFLSSLLAWTVFGCGDDITEYEQYPNNGRVIGSVNGRVMDGLTGDLIQGAVVTYADEGGVHSTTTNALGYYSINNLDTGEYVITFGASTGFATMSITVEIPSLEEIGIVDIPTDADFHHSIARDVDLFPLTSALSGTVYEQIDDGELVPGQQVRVTADFSAYNLSPALYVATTNSAGGFVFGNLPAAPAATIRINSFSDGDYTFGAYLGTVSLMPGGSVFVDDIVVNTLQSEPFIVSDNISQGRFPIGDDIVLTYNKAMDAAQFVVALQGQTEVEIGDISWSQDGQTVTIHPDETLRLSQLYDLSLVGVAVDNSFYQEQRQFSTQRGIEIESTNLQPFEGTYQMAADSDIIIRYSEPVDADAAGNQFFVNGNPVTADLFNSDRSIRISPPEAGYPGPDVSIWVTVYSTLAPYDNVVFNRTISIQP
jgi:hypothetical protein